MSGADLHPNAIDGTTGTELTPASQTSYDSRYARTIGATITPTSNSTTTLKVTKADGTTQVFDIDTTNGRIGINTATPGAALDLGTGGIDIDYGNFIRLGRADNNWKMGVTLSSHPVTASLITTNRNTIVHSTGANDGVVIGPSGGNSTVEFASSNNVFFRGKVGINTGSTAPHSRLQITGPIATAITTSAKTSAYTVAADDSTITADASGGAFQVTLPTAASIAGRQYTIKRTGATNNVTVGTTSVQTIDGASTKTLGTQFATITVQSDGSNWVILNQMGTVS